MSYNEGLGRLAPCLAALVLLASMLPAAATRASAFGGLGLGFVPVPPARVLDTRAGFQTIDELSAGVGSLGPSATLSLHVAGRAGVPAVGVGSVVLNVTALHATAPTFVTVFAGGSARPYTSNLNPSPGIVSANLVIAQVSATGDVSIYNNAGDLDLVVDVAGWFPVGPAFTPVPPQRLLDTRNGAPAGPDSTTRVQVTDRAGIPVRGAGAVVLDIVAVDASVESYLTVYPTGQARPVASNLNPTPGVTTPGLVVAPVGADGTVSLYNFAGSVDLVVDVLGWFPDGPSFAALVPARLLDTRAGRTTVDGVSQGSGPVAGGITTRLHVAGRGGVPALGAGSVLVNLTVTEAASSSYLSAFAAGSVRPVVSNLNPRAGATVANLAVVQLNGDGDIAVYTHRGPLHIVVDVLGWFPPSAGTPALTQTAGGADHSCAVAGGGAVRCWGSNDRGQLGSAAVDAAGTNVPVAVDDLHGVAAVTTGARHSCALTVTGQGWCWGAAASGQLGNGDPTLSDSVAPRQVTGVPTLVALGAGGDHTCAVDVARAVWCWGGNDSGQAGDSSLLNLGVPRRVDGLPDIAAVAVGGQSSCALALVGTVWCWGADESGQLGDGDASGALRSEPHIVAGVAGASSISVGATHACATTPGGVLCWGGNVFGQLGSGVASALRHPTAAVVVGVDGATQVAAGSRHTCAVIGDGSLRCWGDDTFGALGNGDGVDPPPGTAVGVAAVATAATVSAGDGHTCVTLRDNAVLCWGSNDSGQLGDGDGAFADRTAPVEVAA